MENVKSEIVGDEVFVYGIDSKDELEKAITMLVSGKVRSVSLRGSMEQFLNEYGLWDDLSDIFWNFNGVVTLDKLYMPDELSDVRIQLDGSIKEGYVDFYVV